MSSRAVGDGVTEFAPGDEVLGWSWTRSSQAEFVAVPVTQLVAKPAALSWEVAGSLNVAGSTAWAAVDAVDPKPGETVVVSAAAGGVGSIAVQLLRVRGVERDRDRVGGQPRVAAVARRHAGRLRRRARGARPCRGTRTASTRSSTPSGPSTSTSRVALGVAPERIDTIISFERAAEVGAKTAGSVDGSTTEAMAELAELAATGRSRFRSPRPTRSTRVQDAFAELEQRHTRGKIVLIP